MRHPKLLLFLALAATPALAAPGAPKPTPTTAPAVSVAPPSVSTAPAASTQAPTTLSTTPRNVTLPAHAPSAEDVKMAIPRARVQLPKYLRNPDGTLNVKRRAVKDDRPKWWRRMRLLIENPAALRKG